MRNIVHTSDAPALATARLRLRRWRDDDREPFAAMNADPLVMRFLSGPADRAASDAIADQTELAFDRDGFGLWAVERLADQRFIGFIGLQRIVDGFPFAPCVEIGWRLASDTWGQGYASEGAVAVRDLAFGSLDLNELVSITATINTPSRRVMARIGMTANPREDFDLPGLPEGDPLRPHVLYRLRRESATA